MKKLTKKSLNELAKVMPKIAEKQQRELIGCAKYYNHNGEYLGMIGTGDEMRVISNSDFDVYAAGIYEEGTLFGIGLLDASDTEKMAVLTNFLPFGITGVEFLDEPVKGQQAGLDSNGNFYINKNGFILENASSIVNTIVHEEYHFDNEHYTGSISDGQELDTLMYQINDSSYENTNQEYRLFVANQLYNSSNISYAEALQLARVYD